MVLFLLNHEEHEAKKEKILHAFLLLRALRVLRGKNWTFYWSIKNGGFIIYRSGLLL